MNHPSKTTDVHWQRVAFSSSSLSATEQRYAQIEKETLAIVHAFRKFDKLLFGKSGITVHSDHKPLETFFKRSLVSAPRRLQSMMLTLQRYLFSVEYRKGSSLHIADTVSRAPLLETTHGRIHDELVYRVEFEENSPELSDLKYPTVQEIRAEASTDPEQRALRTFIETGWPNYHTRRSHIQTRSCHYTLFSSIKHSSHHTGKFVFRTPKFYATAVLLKIRYASR